MSKFIRTVGKCAINHFSFDIYKNKDGTSTIRTIKRGRNVNSAIKKFSSLQELENWLEVLFYGEITATYVEERAEHVQILKEVMLSDD